MNHRPRSGVFVHQLGNHENVATGYVIHCVSRIHISIGNVTFGKMVNFESMVFQKLNHERIFPMINILPIRVVDESRGKASDGSKTTCSATCRIILKQMGSEHIHFPLGPVDWFLPIISSFHIKKTGHRVKASGLEVFSKSYRPLFLIR